MSLIFKGRRERFVHGRSFVMSERQKSTSQPCNDGMVEDERGVGGGRVCSKMSKRPEATFLVRQNVTLPV